MSDLVGNHIVGFTHDVAQLYCLLFSVTFLSLDNQCESHYLEKSHMSLRTRKTTILGTDQV